MGTRDFAERPGRALRRHHERRVKQWWVRRLRLFRWRDDEEGHEKWVWMMAPRLARRYRCNCYRWDLFRHRAEHRRQRHNARMLLGSAQKVEAAMQEAAPQGAWYRLAILLDGGCV